ncbi:ArsR/SmtB family transcription factor [Thermoactinospora rubra]|uniref:ArsR/SmtB family transcription factor n=1 Tax=Thermoactinospora rubra TaxID=1088767 RepID=UPI001F0B1617|nr:helix-turn-helix domain-containing protein [Thermoactinospora rubra]
MLPVATMRALASEPRLRILHWLKDPVAHFPPQVHGDLVDDGVCSIFIAGKLGMSQPSATGHLKILEAAGLVVGKRVRQWVFYRRDEERIAELKRMIDREL